ncbi:MAG: metallophosphoesterase [Treponema sp.]|nr:metallophosphoesterase [Treponema sp.]
MFFHKSGRGRPLRGRGHNSRRGKLSGGTSPGAFFNAVLFSCAVLLCGAGFCGCTSLRTRSYDLETDRIGAGPIRIAHVSDLHSTFFGKNQEELTGRIRDLEPDLIVLSGDIVDDKRPPGGARALLAGIRDIAPVYYVSGNHEFMSGNIRGIRKELESFGVIILSDEWRKIGINGNTVIVAGVEDPFKKRHEAPGYNQEQAMADAFSVLYAEEGYKILIAHRPENIEQYKKYPFDLVLSGHTHGGQVRIPPFIDGLYAPDQGLFPKYPGGLYRHGRLVHIISRGLSKNMLPRIGNPPELVFIKISGLPSKK